MVEAVQQSSAECTAISTVYYCLKPPTSLCSDNTQNLHRPTVERIPKQCPHARPKVNVLATHKTLRSQPIGREAIDMLRHGASVCSCVQRVDMKYKASRTGKLLSEPVEGHFLVMRGGCIDNKSIKLLLSRSQLCIHIGQTTSILIIRSCIQINKEVNSFLKQMSSSSSVYTMN